MAKLMIHLWIILSGLMAILASVSGMSTCLMVHAQITTFKRGTAELRPWQERPMHLNIF